VFGAARTAGSGATRNAEVGTPAGCSRNSAGDRGSRWIIAIVFGGD
jgi:hypothetical protein